jgi:catechol 2,3-dioxygenase
MPSGTRIGHVHLNVGDLTAAEAFYSGALGFDITVRGYPGALFVSAGGYHHHIGLNTWAGEGAPPPPQGSRGLSQYEIRLPDSAQLAAEEDRLREAGFEPEREDDVVRVTDPSGNRIVLTASA